MLRKMFSKFKKKEQNQYLIQLIEINNFIENLLHKNEYIAKSDYIFKFINNEIIDFFNILRKGELIKNYCHENNISENEVLSILKKIENIEQIINDKNEVYIENTLINEKTYLDTILYEIDPLIKLDENQRRVILTDEDYCLVVAGAGAGKTTTVAAKVKYLVEKKNIPPNEILVVSFTNKAVNELREKLNRELKIPCPISTFHSVGNAILRKNNPEELNIIEGTKLYYLLQDYFKKSILTNESLVNNLIMFFASYFDAPYEGEDLNIFFNNIAKSNYSTLKSELNEVKKEIIDSRTKRKITIKSEVLRSSQEVEIANFLYLNGIEYAYEPIYKYNINLSRKPYTPDFVVKQGNKTAYIEHFGISEDGKNDRFSNDELETYKKSINNKILLHKRHGTNLIYTFSRYKDNRILIEHLKEELINNGFILERLSNQEVMSKLISSEENRYIRKLLFLICRFISNFKVNGYTGEEFNRMYHKTKNVRTKLFLNICQDCYLEYESYLKQNNIVDFEDMINESAKILTESEKLQRDINFKYIIVDEYQDISKQRFDLVKAFSKVSNAKIIAVGDDWQSIYAFSGSDITLFTMFEEKMGYAKLLKIVNTYRNSQEVIDIAGQFIQKNQTQIRKELKSPKNIKDPVIIYTYRTENKKNISDWRSGVNYAIANAVDTAIGQILDFNKEEKLTPESKILLLGRFHFDGDKLEKSGLFRFNSNTRTLRSHKYPTARITFMTAHASKGLGFDNVIVINGRNEIYGFPSKIEDDPVLSLVLKQDPSVEYAEERRLFYVAMTRTKNRVFFIAPEKNPSEFLIEIKREYKNVVLKGNWNEKTSIVQKRNHCPICSYPLQRRFKESYGLDLSICTNEPELCGFMTNNFHAGKLSIIKCERCRDGYLVVKENKSKDFFLGCTNYKKDGSGCDNAIDKREYYALNNYKYSNKEEFEYNMIKLLEEADNISTNQISNNYINIEKAIIGEVKYFDIDLNNTIYIILQVHQKISRIRFYGIGVLMDVLRGSKTNQIINMKFDQIAEYGSLRHIEREVLKDIINWLIENKFILRTNHPRYPVLHPTYEGTNYNKFISESMLKKLKSELIKNDY